MNDGHRHDDGYCDGDCEDYNDCDAEYCDGDDNRLPPCMIITIEGLAVICAFGRHH